MRQTQYDYLWVIAAACPASGAAAGIIMPGTDTQTINVFLGEFSRQLAPEVQAVLIWDGAGFHTARTLEVPANVSLVRLPPYSPELNPIERLFSKLKTALRSAAARTVDGLIEAMGEALRSVRPGDIRGWFAHSGYPTAASTVTLNEKPL